MEKKKCVRAKTGKSCHAANFAPSVQVPVLYDKKTATIVSNESADIIRMLATEFREFAAPKSPELVPRDLGRRIDEVNGWIYDGINNGAYKAGFAKGQLAYDKAFDEYFEALDRVECLLDEHRWAASGGLPRVSFTFRCLRPSLASYPPAIKADFDSLTNCALRPEGSKALLLGSPFLSVQVVKRPFALMIFRYGM